MSDSEFSFDKIRRAVGETKRNDTGLQPDEVARRLADDNAVNILYGDFVLRIERHVVEHARAAVAEIHPDGRRRLMLSVERELRQNIPRLLDKKLSAKRCNETADDLVLWHVLKEVAAQ
jgi:hypothetical protein